MRNVSAAYTWNKAIMRESIVSVKHSDLERRRYNPISRSHLFDELINQVYNTESVSFYPIAAITYLLSI